MEGPTGTTQCTKELGVLGLCSREHGLEFGWRETSELGGTGAPSLNGDIVTMPTKHKLKTLIFQRLSSARHPSPMIFVIGLNSRLHGFF
jgi:hypothetical protein